MFRASFEMSGSSRADEKEPNTGSSFVVVLGVSAISASVLAAFVPLMGYVFLASMCAARTRMC